MEGHYTGARRTLAGNRLGSFPIANLTVTTKRLFQQGEFCVPVAVGGVAVRPGDAILADENGVLVLDPAAVEGAASLAPNIWNTTACVPPYLSGFGILF